MGNENEKDGIKLFKLMQSDISHVVQKSGISFNQLSAVTDQIGNLTSGNPSEYFQMLASDRKFLSVAQKLLAPGLRIDFHRGGAVSTEESYNALFSLTDDDVLILFQSVEEELFLMLFEHIEDFLAWWAPINATEGSGEYEVVFPDIMDTEVLVCALQCIDLYRRSFIESMLIYSGELKVEISKQDYTEILKRALSSGDKRWLLPTMIEITPGLSELQLALKTVHLEKLEKLGFISMDNDTLKLEERSILMGTEIITGWLGSVGCQASIIKNGVPKSLSRMFLTPTPYTNHLVSFIVAEDNISKFKHQTCMREDLIQILQQWIMSLRSIATGDGT